MIWTNSHNKATATAPNTMKRIQSCWSNRLIAVLHFFVQHRKHSVSRTVVLWCCLQESRQTDCVKNASIGSATMSMSSLHRSLESTRDCPRDSRFLRYIVSHEWHWLFLPLVSCVRGMLLRNVMIRQSLVRYGRLCLCKLPRHLLLLADQRITDLRPCVLMACCRKIPQVRPGRALTSLETG